jgi:hypothetical protein
MSPAGRTSIRGQLRGTRRGRLSDPLFRALVTTAGVSVLVILAAMIARTTADSWSIFRYEGLGGFFFGDQWSSGSSRGTDVADFDGTYGAWPFIYGTFVTSLIAIAIALPLAISVAVYVNHMAPRRLRQPLTYLNGLLEIFQRADTQPATQRGYLQFVKQMCELAAEWYRSQQLKVFSDRHDLWSQADHFARVVHESLDVRDVAYLIANEGRRLIGCDRVSVAIRRGGKYVIEAVSGQDTFDKRSNTTVALGKLATAVARTGEDVWYSGDTSDMAPQVEAALDTYVDESNTKAMAILPLFEPRDDARNVYAVLDGAAIEDLLPNLAAHNPQHVCLYRGELEPDLRGPPHPVAPSVTHLHRRGTLHRPGFRSAGAASRFRA